MFWVAIGLAVTGTGKGVDGRVARVITEPARLGVGIENGVGGTVERAAVLPLQPDNTIISPVTNGRRNRKKEGRPTRFIAAIDQAAGAAPAPEWFRPANR
jgi:hypothetical protein